MAKEKKGKLAERKLGAHLSVAGGYRQVFEKIVQIGGNCLQIFSTSPRGWAIAKVTEAAAKEFAAAKKISGVSPVYFHASYLLNLSDNSRVGALSKKSLIAELTVAAKLGVRGSIVHLGSFKNGDDDSAEHPAYPVLVKNIKEVLDKTPKETVFMIENASNRKIGRRLEEIAKIISDIRNPRLKVCLDTCHLHAAGYDLGGAEKLAAFLKMFDEKIGLERLELFHLNDSRDPFGSLRDRHDNIGEGSVGLEVFRALLNHPKTRALPFIIETPGFEDMGPDKKNLDILKSLITI